MRQRKVTLYVKSFKTPVGTEEIGGRKLVYQNFGPAPGGMAPPPQVHLAYDVESRVKYQFVLSEDQKRVIETVEEVAGRHDFKVEVIDVTQIDALHKTFRKEIRELKTFPTLITDSGRKLETSFSEEAVEKVLSETS